MDANGKSHVLKRIGNLNYSLNEILDMFFRPRIVTPEIRDEIQDCIEEWGRILDAFREEGVNETQVELFKPHMDAVTHYLYNLFDFVSLKSWLANVSKAKSALERFKLVFRTEVDLIPPERVGLFGSSAGTHKILREPIPAAFLRFSVFKDNPSAFSYYKKLAEMGEVATLQQLTEVMGVTLSNTSMIMNKLVKEGWVDAEKDKITKERVFRIKRRVEIPED